MGGRTVGPCTDCVGLGVNRGEKHGDMERTMR